MSVEIGQIVQDRYRIEALLGGGGQAAVYRAYDMRLEQTVAIKQNTLAGSESLKQFKREALLLARIRHPNLPRVIDHFVTPDGAQHLVMDYIEGEDLAHIVAASGPLPEDEAVAWIRQACSALEYLHSQQPPIIHRDIKPQNIKVTSEGKVYLVDFGIAKLGDAASKTTIGAMGITPGYSPPEQYGIGGTDERSDIYALGATLYTLLTAKSPPPSIALLGGEAQLVPPRRVNPTVSLAVQQAVLRAMEARRTNRPQNVAEFRQMLAAPSVELATTEVAGARNEQPVALGQAPASRAATTAPAQPLRVQPSPLPLWLAGAGIVALVIAVGILALVAVMLSRSSQAALLPTRPPTQAAALAPIAARPTLTALPAPTEVLPTPTQILLTPTAEMAAMAMTSTTPACTAIGQTMTRSQDKAEMVCVPAGPFLMGSASTDRNAQADEKPQHTVTLDAFWIDRTEVTNMQYEMCVQAGICKGTMHMDGSMTMEDDQPAANMDWDNAAAYCKWVDGALPTEAQWEKAARGTDGRVYPWGSQAATCNYAVMDDGKGASCGKGSMPWSVGSKLQGASPYGVMDMAGNVWEFVSDWYDPAYYAKSPAANPQGPSSGKEHTVRGGSLFMDPNHVRAAFRGSSVTHAVHGSQGFRCVVAPGG